MRRVCSFVVVGVALAACTGGAAEVDDEGAYRFEYELHDGSGTVLVVADGGSGEDPPRVYVDGELIGEADPRTWTDTSTPEVVTALDDLSNCETLRLILVTFADIFYRERDIFGEPRSYESGGYLQYGADRADELGCDFEIDTSAG
jgi:hypothetical protein